MPRDTGFGLPILGDVCFDIRILVSTIEGHNTLASYFLAIKVVAFMCIHSLVSILLSPAGPQLDACL